MLRTISALIVFGLVLSGCGGDDTRSTATPPASAQASQTTATLTKVRLAVFNRRTTVLTETVAVKGEVTRGATVTVRGQQAQVIEGQFRKTLNLRVGENRFTVVARHAGRRTTHQRLRIVRKLPAPPIAAPTAVPAAPAVPPAGGYPPPGQCGVSPATGDPVCTQSDGSLERGPDAPGASAPPPPKGTIGGGQNCTAGSCPSTGAGTPP